MGCFKPNFIIKHQLDPIRWLELKHSDPKLLEMKVSKDKPFEYCFCHRSKLEGMRDYFKDWNVGDYELIPIPCGNCIGCRLDYSMEWATRCMLEAEQYKHNYFLTLTYDDEHLPTNKLGNHSLVPEDFVNFMKRLRITFYRKYGFENIRFFASGEYGDKSFRPHYHIILFNCPIPDLTPEFRYKDENGREVVTHHVKDGNIYYWSKDIHSIWNKGNIVIGECSYHSCAYVARYVVKKQKGKSGDEAYKKLGIEAPFCRMSRSPGIAYIYFITRKDSIYDMDSVILSTVSGAQLVPPPRYFDKMFEIENEIRYYAIKKARQQKCDDYLNTLYENTTLHYDDYLEVLEERKELQISSLCRNI